MSLCKKSIKTQFIDCLNSWKEKVYMSVWGWLYVWWQSMNWALKWSENKVLEVCMISLELSQKPLTNFMLWESGGSENESEKFYPQKLITLRCCLYGGLVGIL